MLSEELTDIEKQAQELVKNYFDSGDSEHFDKLFGTDESVLEALLYIIFQEALDANDLIPTTYLHQATPEQEAQLGSNCECGECAGGDGSHASPVFLVPAIVLRQMMQSAMAIGMKYQKDTSRLDNIWGGE